MIAQPEILIARHHDHPPAVDGDVQAVHFLHDIVVGRVLQAQARTRVGAAAFGDGLLAASKKGNFEHVWTREHLMRGPVTSTTIGARRATANTNFFLGPCPVRP